MKKNVGGVDRGVRIVLGVALAVVAFLVPMGQVVRIVCLVLAAIALVTGLLRTCGLYTLLGIDTNKHA